VPAQRRPRAAVRPAPGVPGPSSRAGASRRPAGPSAGDGPPRRQVAEIQRSRLLAGAAEAVEEVGYARATVQQIVSRARIARLAFYELFADREACLAALLEDIAARIEEEIAAAAPAGLLWRERVRGGLWAILSFCDREPALARVCVVGALQGGPEVLARRGKALARLAGALDEGRGESPRGAECTALTAEGLVAAAFGILHARLARGGRRRLTALHGELMGMIVLPYLGPAAARRERTRPAPAPPRSGRGLPRGAPMRMTYRTARVLECVAEQGGRGSAPSNRDVSDGAGIPDDGQISKLLKRLQSLGLMVNSNAGHALGEPNAWTLTPLGRQVAGGIGMRTRGRREAA
jgi:AcrR family transcriptional regulator